MDIRSRNRFQEIFKVSAIAAQAMIFFANEKLLEPVKISSVEIVKERLPSFSV